MRVLVISGLLPWMLLGIAVAQNNQTTSGSSSKAQSQAASQASPQATPTIATYLNSANKNALKMTVKASRQQAVAGSDFGITAIIENISANPIYFVPGAFSMTAPPEIDSEGPRDWLAFFPGILVPSNQSYDDTVIVLEPGSNISAFWAGQRSTPEGTAAKSFLDRITLEFHDFTKSLTFSPGQYSLAIVGSYWDTHEGAQLKSVEHHTQTAEVIETITAPQKVVLLGAAVGGIIAFLLLSRLYPTGAWSNVKLVTGIISSILLSTIVTILLSRLSQSQFIVQVTVNDFWGAMAVGFLITATGPTILQKFVGLVQTSPPQGSSQATIPQSPGNGSSGKNTELVEDTHIQTTTASKPHSNGDDVTSSDQVLR